MTEVFLDFETYYAKGYTLSSPKLAMSEYVRHPEFKAHMVQWAVDDGPIFWCPHEDIAHHLAKIDWSNATLVSHNTAFDGFILHEHYGITPAVYADTMLLSRAVFGANVSHSLNDVGERLGLGGKVDAEALEDVKGIRDLSEEQLNRLAGYGARDVDLMRLIYRVLKPRVPEDELALMDLTLLMFCKPALHLDVERIERALSAEVGKKVAALMKAGVTADQLLSNDAFAQLLRSHAGHVPMKISPTTGKATYAFAKKDQGFLALKSHPNEDVRRVVEARLAVKSTIGETRAMRFLEAGRNGGKLPVLLQYNGAHTTRWSAGNKMNLQNLPRKGELRQSILAPPGHVLVVVDSAQIEARTNLWLAGDDEKLQVFRDYDAGVGPDLYKVTASKVFGVPLAEVTADQRQLGKVLVLALGYGMGAPKLQDTLAVDAFNPISLSLQECYDMVSAWRKLNEPIVNLWSRMEKLASFMIFGEPLQYKALRFEKNQLVLPSGCGIHYDNLRGVWNDYTQCFADLSFMGRNGHVKLYGGLLTENAVQGLARCIVASQMLTIAQRYRVVMMTHDEVVYIAPEAEAEEAFQYGLAAFRTPPTWAPDLPVKANGGYARNYSK